MTLALLSVTLVNKYSYKDKMVMESVKKVVRLN